MTLKRTLGMAVLALGFVGGGLTAERAADEPLSVSSPDGRLIISMSLKSNPQPYLPGERAYYRVSYNGTPVLADSPLGLDFLGSPPLDEDFEVVAADRQTHDSSWENRFGARREVPDHYNQLTISLKERRAPGRRLDLVFRAYDEGVAFRYILPAQEHLRTFALSSEMTGFYFAREATAWTLNMGRFNTHNEGEYLPAKLADIKPASIINLPLLVEVPGGPWVALLEAELTDYAGLYVGGVPGTANALVSKLSMPPRKENVARNLTTTERAALEQPVVGRTPKETPWRVLMIAPTPGRLIETNYLILNLSRPCMLSDISWIKPGKAAWDWWSGSYATGVSFNPGMNTPTMEHYIDFAAAHHFEYMLVDAGWAVPGTEGRPEDILNFVPEVNVPEIITYGNQKSVKVLLWVDWRALDAHLEEALSLYEKWGAAGIKVDYMNRDDQEMVNFYERVVRAAAAHHLTVDFHGAYKGTGLRRAYPNLLTREGVMGMEYNKWSDRVTPVYDVTIPFTRMLAGPMDFTPGAMRNAARGQFKALDIEPMSQGTRAHQLAMYVVYESPLVMVSDYPEAYEKQPGLEFIERVPAVWDDTRVPDGRPGEFVVVARRNGTSWYLGAMTNWEARDLTIPLTFLGNGSYEARIFADGPDADKIGTSLAVTRKIVKAGDKFTVHLAPGGGAAVILIPMK